MTGVRLQMEGIRKSFGSTHALRGVDLEVAPGEVHALVGENGAGKSTLMKILSGAERPDSGSMRLNGSPYQPRSPQDARLRGVAMVYQELALAPHLDVETNIMLGLEEHHWGFVRRTRHRQRVRAALALLQHPEIEPGTPVHRLRFGARQLIEVARALVVDARVIVLDEPTSALTQADKSHLFDLIRRLRERGVSIIYISHFLEELPGLADRLTVLRDGQRIGTEPMQDISLDRIVTMMVGRNLAELYPQIPHAMGEPVLQLRGLAGETLPRRVDLTLHAGEILGIFGLVGAGRTESLRTLFGLDVLRKGVIEVDAKTGGAATPRQRIRQGLGLLSEDRKQEGLALSQNITDNLTYSWLTPYSRWGWLHLRRRRAAALQWLDQLRVRCRGPEQRVAELSGGNQQKIALARLLHQEARILLLDEPTRGVDVSSKAEIYRLIGELAQQGKAIVFVSSYLPELLGVCDRLAVMNRGRLGEPRPVSAWSEAQIMAQATGGIG